MSDISFYAKMAPIKLFFMVAIPGAISMIASSLWGIFDGIFVGKLVGETAFAALNFAFPLVLMNFSLADLIGVGSSVLISIALGKRQEEEASNCFTCACLMIFITGTITGAVLFFAAPYLMEFMGAEGMLLDMAVRYIRVYAIASPLTTMMFAVDNFLRICGKIKSSMWINIAMSVVILVLEYFCVAIFQMGIAGSAFAVSGGIFVCTLIALYPFAKGNLVLKFCKPHFSWGMVRQIVSNGSPNFLSSIAGRLTSILMNVILLRIGGALAVSVYGVLLYVGDTILQFLYGTCDALQPAIGYNWGAGKKKRVKAFAKCCMSACATISAIGVILMMLCPRQLALLFVDASETVLLTASVYAMRIYCIMYLTRWFSFSVQSVLIALEKSMQATMLSVSYALVIPVALIPILWSLKLDGIWMNGPITAALVAVLALIFFVRIWRELTHKSKESVD